MKKITQIVLPVLAVVLFLAVLPMRAQAIPFTLNFTYSGASFGNGATATGFIKLDSSYLAPTPADGNSRMISFADVLGFQITVSGASAGNGTFYAGQYDTFRWYTNGATTLDFTRELIGQSLGVDPLLGVETFFGTNPIVFTSGDFGLVSNTTNYPAAPNFYDYFVMQTNGGGSGDWMALTSLMGDPANTVPEPATLLLLGAGLGGIRLLRRRGSGQA